jgi:hypothetical protein
MEALTRLVSESLARYGLDRPVDYRRLQWSRWFRCESPHSLLFVPSKPGVFAIAEELMDLGRSESRGESEPCESTTKESLQGPHSLAQHVSAGSDRRREPVPEGRRSDSSRRMLAVLQFGEDDDMAFVLDRMLSRDNPMRARLVSGRCFVRFVVIEDESQRRNICNALNQWLISTGEKVSGIGAHFASSLELNVARAPSPANAGSPALSQQSELGLNSDPESLGRTQTALPLDPGPATNIRCPQPLPSGF